MKSTTQLYLIHLICSIPTFYLSFLDEIGNNQWFLRLPKVSPFPEIIFQVLREVADGLWLLFLSHFCCVPSVSLLSSLVLLAEVSKKICLTWFYSVSLNFPATDWQVVKTFARELGKISPIKWRLSKDKIFLILAIDFCCSSYQVMTNV